MKELENKYSSRERKATRGPGRPKKEEEPPNKTGYETKSEEEVPNLAPPPLTKREKDQASDLAGLYMIIGTIVMPFRKDIATRVIASSDEAGYQWVMLARRSTKVRNYVESLTAASVWSKVVAVHVKMLAPGIVIPFGGTEPDVSSDQLDFDQFFNSMTDEQMNQATAMAMQFMQSQPVNDNGESAPVENVVTDSAGHPIGSAEYKAPPMNPQDYPFPMNAQPPDG